MSVAALACVAIALIPLGSILVEAAGRGAQAINAAFFLSNTVVGGIGNAIQGTLILVVLSGVIAIPVGILAGIYVSEYGNNRLGRALRFFNDVMTQIPSIVIGIFAFSIIFELSLLNVGSPRLATSTGAGVIALATIMIPFVARTAEEALRLVPVSTREAALALGIPKYRVTLRIVLSSASGGLVTGALLAVARAAGETAPLLMTSAGSDFGFAGLDQPIASLTVTVYRFALDPRTSYNQAAWGAALVLTLIMLLISIASRVLFRRRFGVRGDGA
jgi:phosphate transport system permease protein